MRSLDPKPMDEDDDVEKPMLPPRRTETDLGLMDKDEGRQIEGWEVMRPER